MISDYRSLKAFWKNKKVFLTGHTGFKGCWLSIFLTLLGAKVSGYSLRPKTKPNLFYLAGIDKIIYQSKFGDIRNYKKLKTSILNFKPDFVIHMAAQALVRESYKNPKYTFDVNAIGTLNIIDIIHQTNCVKSVLIITTDKVYKIREDKKKYYKEVDELGGSDPYSSSKTCSEFIIQSYKKSFLDNKKITVAVARSGNVIGGGDFSNDRIIPDFIKSLKTKKILLRLPNSIRPWQHVIEPLFGYILLLTNLSKKKITDSSNIWNFGPQKSSNISVKKIIKKINYYFNNSVKILVKNKKNIFKETNLLVLNSQKAKKLLKWKPLWNIEKTIKLTADWYRSYLLNEDMKEVTLKQINNFLSNKKK